MRAMFIFVLVTACHLNHVIVSDKLLIYSPGNFLLDDIGIVLQQRVSACQSIQYLAVQYWLKLGH